MKLGRTWMIKRNILIDLTVLLERATTSPLSHDFLKKANITKKLLLVVLHFNHYKYIV